MISEYKLDLCFLDTQFQIANYNMFRKDRNKNGDGLLFYVIYVILNCKIVNTYNSLTYIKILPLELAFQKEMTHFKFIQVCFTLI